jgi:hypothetical protein
MIEPLLPLLLSASVVIPGSAGRPASLADQAVARQDSVRVTAFLTLLASAWTPLAEEGGYDPRRARPWDVRKLAPFFAPSGVTFFDVNGDTTWHVDAQALRRELNQRRGAAFDMLLHLGYIYDLRRPEYAALSFKHDHGRLVATVGTSAWYRVTFVSDGGVLRVAKVEYLEREGG